jgi:hypothetical protein
MEKAMKEMVEVYDEIKKDEARGNWQNWQRNETSVFNDAGSVDE